MQFKTFMIKNIKHSVSYTLFPFILNNIYFVYNYVIPTLVYGNRYIKYLHLYNMYMV